MSSQLADRACGRCRQRRVKCDKRQPACLRCEKFSQPCPGYGPRHKFLDEGAKVRKRYGNDGGLLNHPFDHESGLSIDGSSRVASPTTDDSTPSTSWLQLGNHIIRASTQVSPNEIQSMPSTRPVNQDAMDTEQMGPNEMPQDYGNYFDIDIEEYYALGNNSCGFVPGLSAAAMEVEQIEPESADFSMLDLESGNETTSAGESANPVGQSIHSSQNKRRREVSCLVAHFTEAIAPWLDLFNPESYFTQDVPLQAVGNVLLKYALAAMAAKHFGLLVSNKLARKNAVPQSIIAQNFHDSEQLDWFYKAANYYDKAISYLRFYLQNIAKAKDSSSSIPTSREETSTDANYRNDLSQFQKVRTRVGDGRSSETDPEIVLAAISIFSLYESLNNYEAEWLHHLSGFQSLLTMKLSLQTPFEDGLFSYDQQKQLSKAGRAAFWNFAHDDSLASYISRSQTRLDTGNVRLWNAVGLRFDPDGMIRSGSSLSSEYSSGWSIIWILLKVMNYAMSVDESATGNSFNSGKFLGPSATHTRFHSGERNSQWADLRRLLKIWYDTLPDTFKPYAKLPHLNKSSHNSPENTSGFTKLFFTRPICAASLQMYHFAQILLLSRQPIDIQSTGNNFGNRFRLYRQVSEESEYHSREICGIALGRPSPAVRVNMIQPLYMAGKCLENNKDRQVVLDLLIGIECDTGYSTGYRVNELRSEWGWKAR